MPRVVGGLAAAVAGAAVVALIYAFAVLDPTGRGVDNHLFRIVGRIGHPVRGPLRFVLDVAAPTVTLGVLMLVVAIWRCRRRGRACAVAAVVLGSQAIVQLLKTLLPSPTGVNTLPSGHVTVAATTVVALLVLFPRRSTAVLAVGVPAVLATAVATMLVGWHRPSDVLAALAVVAAVGGLTLAAAGFLSPRACPAPAPGSARVTWPSQGWRRWAPFWVATRPPSRSRWRRDRWQGRPRSPDHMRCRRSGLSGVVADQPGGGRGSTAGGGSPAVPGMVAVVGCWS